METRARYALIGLFMFAVILVSFGFVFWLQNKGGFGERTSYSIQFKSSVSGLLVGSAVLFNGIRVGDVTGIALNPDAPQQVIATIAVNRNTPIREDTRVNVEKYGTNTYAGDGPVDPPPPTDFGARFQMIGTLYDEAGHDLGEHEMSVMPRKITPL